MKLDEFIGLFGGLEEAEFKVRFPHPFLLERPELLADPSARRVLLVRGTKGNPLAIGRGARCHLPIRDRLVSTKHAELLPPEADGGPWRLVDAGSTNGTFLGGTKLEPNVPVELGDRATLSLGPDTSFEFVLLDTFFTLLKKTLTARHPRPAQREGNDAEATDAFDETMRHGALTTGEATDTTDKPTRRRWNANEPERRGDELLLVCGDLDPLPLPIGHTIVIGRKPETADFVLVDGRISRRHAEIRRTKDGLAIRDLGSANGTYLGGRELGPDWTRLLIGQVITVGPFDLYVGAPQSHGTDRWDDEQDGGTVHVR